MLLQALFSRLETLKRLNPFDNEAGKMADNEAREMRSVVEFKVMGRIVHWTRVFMNGYVC